MSDQLLRDALHRLADDAPAIDTTESTSGRTWQQARAARRRGIVAVSLAAALVLVGGFLAIGVTVSERPQPAKPPPYDESALAIPNKIWMPSPWTSSTDDKGPLGPLAMIATAPHNDSWFHTDDNAVFGVSAVDGSYRFIDLPSVDLGGSSVAKVALSPDGTKIGYWLLGNVPSNLKESDDVGFAVYNTVTGKVSRHPVPSRYGVNPAWLTWTGDSGYLVASFAQYAPNTRAGGGTSRGVPAQAWDVGSGTTREISGVDGETVPTTGPGDDVVYFESAHTMVTVDVAAGTRTRTGVNGRGYFGGIISPSGRWLVFGAALADGGARVFSSLTGGVTTDEVDLANRPAGGTATWRASPLDTHSEATGVVGWLDDSHVLVRVWSTSRSRAMARERLASLDVQSGQLTTQMQLVGRQQVWPDPAIGLLSRPFRRGQAPPSYQDPRLLPGITMGIVAGLLVIIGLGWLYRRGQDFERKPVGGTP